MKTAGWFQSPTKKHLALFAILWLLGSLLQVASLTSFFTAPVAGTSSIALTMLVWLPATAALVRLYGNFLRHRQPVA